MIIYIYKITNFINGKIYIGKSQDPETRFKKHYTSSVRKFKEGDKLYYFQNAIIKYGIENFSWTIIDWTELNDDKLSKKEILEYLNKQASELEIYYIRYFDSKNRKIGYNSTDGGEGVVGRESTKEEIEKRAAKLRGRKLSYEHRMKISLGNMGKKVSDGAKKKISEKNSGENNGMFGRPSTADNKKLLSVKITEAKKNTHFVHPDLTAQGLKISEGLKNRQIVDDEIKDTICELYDSCQFTKQNIADQFNLKFKTVRSIINNWPDTKLNKTKLRTHWRKKSEYIKSELNIKLKQLENVAKIKGNLVVLTDEVLLREYNENKNIKVIAEKFKYNKKTIKRRLEFLGIILEKQNYQKQMFIDKPGIGDKISKANKLYWKENPMTPEKAANVKFKNLETAAKKKGNLIVLTDEILLEKFAELNDAYLIADLFKYNKSVIVRRLTKLGIKSKPGPKKKT